MRSPWALVPKRVRSAGSPRLLADLSPCAVPNHPGEPGGRSRPLLHRQYQASSGLGGWRLSVYGNEAESGSLALRLPGSPHQASPGEFLHCMLARLTERAYWLNRVTGKRRTYLLRSARAKSPTADASSEIRNEDYVGH